ncbi:methyl-accepting chemotaxis sensory transducer with Pas/Pac sensor [Caballeronia arationis]|jgi:aerotaxis receptor|uniref:Methyl-accepting chemotaxis sensory transducer with Pas/Pac sensor n=1 Tax=Caballeronia arationis TaxID=1777142 RepID=A0A7Z7N1Y3_9BURK|nr:PAS domain-containing methyl-accepting chemotaxis protein [Caballeronia arationis]SAK82788.1 methyl-accepting chemotaxis sensory transducer with Pas/Pac sensor [Caballeronia arationis]SOE62513.1 methyl-accepting chemotaxis sensory transducer with Pas/Pac sensor [Caballeronia arationis]
MRNNQPVTQHEYDYPASQMLVSATDLSGNIQYCNPAFIAVSGYSKEELTGQPHNVIRHPDMPREAFADLWSTIRSGRSWTALVKNRRKDGDHYWVRANVTPVLENGKTVGYLSVRVKPGRDEVKAAEALYAQIRAGTLRSARLERGALLRTGIAGSLQRLARLSLSSRMAASHAAAPVALAVAGFAAWRGAPPLPFWIAFAASAAAAACGWLALTRQVDAPVRTMSGFAARMAAGDLTAETQAGAEGDLGDVQRALNQLKANLSAIVFDVRGQIGGLLDSAREISSGNTELSRRTESQASSLQETATAMEQITATVEGNANASARALDVVREALAAANDGDRIASQVEEKMAGINAAARRIADITDVIDGIAFQTNILALNAAVEAARAGEAGRSFAVVASEVRNLAQRSAAAAKEIGAVVTASAAQIKAGTGLVARTTSQMRAIDAAVNRVSAIILEVANASSEQALGIRQVNQAVANLDDATQQNAALVEQAAATAQSLVDRAGVLDEAVRLFTVEQIEDRVRVSA